MTTGQIVKFVLCFAGGVVAEQQARRVDAARAIGDAARFVTDIFADKGTPAERSGTKADRTGGDRIE